MQNKILGDYEGEPGSGTVVVNGKIYTVDQTGGTISDGEYVYHFKVSGGGSSVNYEITYPNGAAYFWTQSGNGGDGGWSDNYDDSKYAEGDVLIDVLTSRMPKRSEPKNAALIIILAAVGLFNTFAPETSWYLSRGWQYKNAEPSDAALLFTRAGGVIALAAAAIMIII